MKEWEILTRVLVAALAGGLVGLERERGDRPAGLKTYLLVAMGACLFTVLSLLAFPRDPARVAAQVVVGIGFLGAGVIVVYGGTHIVGITTAATMWATAALGMAAGLGYYLTVTYVTGIILAVLVFLPWVEQRAVERIRKRRLYFNINAGPEKEILQRVRRIFQDKKCHTSILRYGVSEHDEVCSILFMVTVSPRTDLEELVRELQSLPGVVSVTFEE